MVKFFDEKKAEIYNNLMFSCSTEFLECGLFIFNSKLCYKQLLDFSVAVTADYLLFCLISFLS